MGKALDLPDPKLPIAPVIPRVNLDIPTAEIPTYKPIVVQSNSLNPNQGQTLFL